MAAKPLSDEQKADAARLRALFKSRQDKDPSLTQESLAFACKWKTQGAVSQYLLGKIPLNLRALLKFSKALDAAPANISPTLAKQIHEIATRSSKDYGAEPGTIYQAAQERLSYDKNVLAARSEVRPIPVISAIQAGKLTEITDAYPAGAGFDIEYTSEEVSRWTFALEITGTSMLPEFRAGDRVIIDPELAPNPGDYVVAKNTSEEATFKKYKLRGIDASGNNIFELVPLNDEYATLRSDIDHLKIIGVMVEHRKKYRRKKD
jgi:SOS-response transcriptional repressor LexA